MTIKQFLEKQTLNSGAKLRFQFTDRQGVNWSCEAPASRFEGELIENFLCDLKHKESNLFTFNLDLNEIPEGLFTTFSEIYEQAAKKSDEENITVQEYLQELEKGFDEGTNPKVFFYQKILIKDSNGRENIYSFATQNAVSLKEAVNGPLSHLFVDNVETRDDTIFVNLVTTAEEINMRIQQEEQQQKAQQEEADKRFANAFDIFCYIGIGVSMTVGTWLGWHSGGGLDRLAQSIPCSLLGLLGGLVGSLGFGLIVLDILKEIGKFPYN